MGCNENKSIIRATLQRLYDSYPMISTIIGSLDLAGAKTYFVGGVVRDILLQRVIKDIDVEIHGLSADVVAMILQRFGAVNYVGKIYGVFKINSIPVDWSLPRCDTAGRKPHIVINPDMSLENALIRRDLTMNAMAIDSQSEELIDPFNGAMDIKQKILRTPDVCFFSQDPLRFFRIMQFISRFEMYPDQQLQAICCRMDISDVSRERIQQEFAKMLLFSKKPSLGIRWMLDINRLSEVLPELADTVHVPQDPRWHPEGNVFEHSMQALDAAATMEYSDDNEKLCILYAALCHDLGKVSTTFQDEKGIHSHGHAHVGQPYVRSMLSRVTGNKKLISKVVGLVRWHMYLYDMPNDASEKKIAFFVKRLAYYLSLYKVNIIMFARLVIADRQGRNCQGPSPLTQQVPEVDLLLMYARKFDVAYDKEAPLLTGADFIEFFKQGPIIGMAVKEAYRRQLKGVQDPQLLKRMVIRDVAKKLH